MLRGCVDKIMSNGFLHNNGFQEGRLLMIKASAAVGKISPYLCLNVNNGVERRQSVISSCMGKISPNNIMVDKHVPLPT